MFPAPTILSKQFCPVVNLLRAVGIWLTEPADTLAIIVEEPYLSDWVIVLMKMLKLQAALVAASIVLKSVFVWRS